MHRLQHPEYRCLAQPAEPEQELRYWYQYYFHTERGRNGLIENRRGLCELLWRCGRRHWAFDDATFERTAASFENPDFVDVVIQSYRHRMKAAPGDPRLCRDRGATRQAAKINVPAITVHGAVDGVGPVQSSENHARYFGGPYQRRVFANVGHNPPQEDPKAFADAILRPVQDRSDLRPHATHKKIRRKQRFRRIAIFENAPSGLHRRLHRFRRDRQRAHARAAGVEDRVGERRRDHRHRRLADAGGGSPLAMTLTATSGIWLIRIGV